MLAHLLSDILAFFSKRGCSISTEPAEYIRLIRVINQTYQQLASEYPLPELDSITAIRIDNDDQHSSAYLCDYIPYPSRDTRKLDKVPLQLLEVFTMAEIFGMQGKIPDSRVSVNNVPISLIQRKVFCVEHSAFIMKELLNTTIQPFSSYNFYNLHNMSTWATDLYIDGQLYKSFTEQSNRFESITTTAYGTIRFDFRLQKLQIQSGNTTFKIVVKSSFFTNPYTAVSDTLGIRFTHAYGFKNGSTILFSQVNQPPMLLVDDDKTLNSAYDQALVLYTVENLATYTRDLFSKEVLQSLASKRQEQLARLVKIVSNYRTRRFPKNDEIPLIGRGVYGYY